MNTLDLRTATLDEIVFEGRNKMYGAYVLRQLYQRHLAKALAIAISLTLLLVCSPLIMAWLFPPLIEAAPITVQDGLEFEVLPPPILEKAKSIAGLVKPAIVLRPRAEAVPRVVANDKFKPDAIPDKPLVADASVIDVDGPSTAVGPATGSDDVVASSTGADSGKAAANSAPSFFLTAEVMPEFVGGPAALQRYMQKNLRFPPQALRNGVDGRVYISFTVQSDGSIADVQVLKGLGFGTDEEATRVVKNMPTWNPGKQNKHAVAVRYTMPITFRYE